MFDLLILGNFSYFFLLEIVRRDAIVFAIFRVEETSERNRFLILLFLKYCIDEEKHV